MNLDLSAVMDATWPAARIWREGGWTLRDGAGGGKRVSAATLCDDPGTEPPPLVMVREGEDALDALLAARGYAVVDPVVAYAAPVSLLAEEGAGADAHWPPSDAARALWAEGGIGPSRVAVMARVSGPRSVIANTSGAAFVALHGQTAMLHALEVSPAHRRQGAARAILRGSALWAQAQGARTFSLVVTVANAPARALYAAMGMDEAGRYHYRQRP